MNQEECSIFDIDMLQEEEQVEYFQYINHVLNNPYDIEQWELENIWERAFSITLKEPDSCQIIWNESNLYYKDLILFLYFHCEESLPEYSYSYCLQHTNNEIIYAGISLHIYQKIVDDLKVFEGERVKYLLEKYLQNIYWKYEYEMDMAIREEDLQSHLKLFGEKE